MSTESKSGTTPIASNKNIEKQQNQQNQQTVGPEEPHSKRWGLHGNEKQFILERMELGLTNSQIREAFLESAADFDFELPTSKQIRNFVCKTRAKRKTESREWEAAASLNDCTPRVKQFSSHCDEKITIWKSQSLSGRSHSRSSHPRTCKMNSNSIKNQPSSSHNCNAKEGGGNKSSSRELVPFNAGKSGKSQRLEVQIEDEPHSVDPGLPEFVAYLIERNNTEEALELFLLVTDFEAKNTTFYVQLLLLNFLENCLEVCGVHAKEEEKKLFTAKALDIGKKVMALADRLEDDLDFEAEFGGEIEQTLKLIWRCNDIEEVSGHYLLSKRQEIAQRALRVMAISLEEDN